MSSRPARAATAGFPLALALAAAAGATDVRPVDVVYRTVGQNRLRVEAILDRSPAPRPEARHD
jgi:catabolite regulation protein CreA